MKLVTRKLFNGECMKKRITLIVFSVLIIVALYVLYCFNYIPHKKYTNADFNIEAYKSNIDKDNDGIDDQTDILNNANLLYFILSYLIYYFSKILYIYFNK